MVLVAVDGFHAEFDAPCLGLPGGNGHDFRDVVDLALGRRQAGSLADTAIDDAAKRQAAQVGSLVDGDREIIDGRVRAQGRPCVLGQAKRADGLEIVCREQLAA